MRTRLSWTALLAVVSCLVAGAFALADAATELVTPLLALGIVLALISLKE